MKEASGELNMTAITIVAIAAIGVFFYTLIWPGIQANIQRTTNCSQATCGTCTNGVAKCTYIDSTGKTIQNYDCPCK